MLLAGLGGQGGTRALERRLAGARARSGRADTERSGAGAELSTPAPGASSAELAVPAAVSRAWYEQWGYGW